MIERVLSCVSPSSKIKLFEEIQSKIDNEIEMLT